MARSESAVINVRIGDGRKVSFVYLFFNLPVPDKRQETDCRAHRHQYYSKDG